MRCPVCKHRGPSIKDDLNDIDLCRKDPFTRSVNRLEFVDMTRNADTVPHVIYRCPKCGILFTPHHLNITPEMSLPALE